MPRTRCGCAWHSSPLSPFITGFFFLFLRSPFFSTTPQQWWLMLTSHCCQNPNSWGQHVTWEQAGPLGLAGREAQFQLSTLQHPLITPPTPSGRGPPTGGEQPFPPAWASGCLGASSSTGSQASAGGAGGERGRRPLEVLRRPLSCLLVLSLGIRVLVLLLENVCRATTQQSARSSCVWFH